MKQNRAYLDGKDVATKGSCLIKMNPYPYNTILHFWWEVGYYEYRLKSALDNLDILVIEKQREEFNG